MFVAGGEDDGAGVIPDEALGDARRAGGSGRGGARTRAAGDGGGADDLDGEGVAGGAGPELVDLGEDGLPERRLVGRRGGHRRCRRCWVGGSGRVGSDRGCKQTLARRWGSVVSLRLRERERERVD